jgi:hypothetical protein
MKYYTISMFSDGTLLESITTKVAVDSMPDKTIKLNYSKVVDMDTMK